MASTTTRGTSWQNEGSRHGGLQVTAVILVADDDPFNLRLLRELCDGAGYRVLTAGSGDEVLEMVSRERPNLILLDLDMPGKSGFEVMEILQGDAKLREIPIIIVTAMGDVDVRNQGLSLGAEDYVTKPFRVFEIQQRVRNVLRIQDAEGRAREANLRAERLSRYSDPVTHCGTSQQLLISLDYEFTRAQRYGNPLSVIVVSIDQAADSSLGAQLDSVLAQASAVLRGCIRGIDHLFRSDELEFSIVLPETDASGVTTVEERIASELPAALQTPEMVAESASPAIRLVTASFPKDAVRTSEELRQLALKRLRKARQSPSH